MKAIIFLAVLAISLAIIPKGTVERVFTKEGLEKFYTETFLFANATFKESLGSHSQYTGWWIFGSELSVYNTHLSHIDMGVVSSGDFDNEKKQYTFHGGPFKATFHYDWEYRFFIFPFHHANHVCDVTFPSYTVTARFIEAADNIDTYFHIEIPYDSLKFVCIDDEKT